MSKIDVGNTKGIKRIIDKQQRLCIPKDFLDALNISTKDKVEIFLTDEGLFIRKERKWKK